MEGQEARALLERYVRDVLGAGDTMALEELFAADVIEHGTLPKDAVGDEQGAVVGVYGSVVTPIETPGREGLKQRILTLRNAFPDARVSLEDISVQGDTVTARWTLRAPQRGTFAGAEATGREVTLQGTDRARVQGGKIVEHWSDVDMEAVRRQLGSAGGSGQGSPSR